MGAEVTLRSKQRRLESIAPPHGFEELELDGVLLAIELVPRAVLLRIPV